METNHYEPIKPLSTKEVDTSVSLPKRTARLWQNERSTIFGEETKRKFYERWGIELGLVENIFRWDRGVTMTLLQQGISAEILVEQSGTTVEEARESTATIAAHVETLEEFEMGFINDEVQFSANSIRQLHEKLLVNQETHDVLVPGQGFAKRTLAKGVFKGTSNDPVDPNPPHKKIKSYCPPEDTDAEVIRLCDLLQSEAVQNASPEVRAAWLHHRFTQVHPFADGNGRVARALASLVLVKEGFLPLMIRRDEDRSIYLDALEKADAGDLSSLVELFIERQRTEILQLMADSSTTSDALEAAKRSLTDRLELRKERADGIFTYLHVGAVNKFNSLSGNISQVLQDGRRSSERFSLGKTRIIKPGDQDAHSFDEDILDSDLDYKPRIADISGFIELSILTEYRFIILIHLHERDLLDGGGFVANALMIEEELDEDRSRTISKIPVDPIFISVEKSVNLGQVQREVVDWAGRSVELGVSFWGKSL